MPPPWHQFLPAGTPLSFTVLWLAGITARLILAPYGHSGFAVPPMHGDFEAQRHWMEITIHTPPHEWYVNTSQNDLLYWGLDYPPGSAWGAASMGHVAHAMVPHAVALRTSRGVEDMPTRIFMRSSVILLDAALYIPAVLWLLWRCMAREQRQQQQQRVSVKQAAVLGLPAVTLLALAPPAQTLIDAGHFQYNGVSIAGGVAWLACVYLATRVRTSRSASVAWLAASVVAYTWAINWKQMALHFAAAVLCIQLVCTRAVAGKVTQRWGGLVFLALLVVQAAMAGATLAMLWLPLCSSLPQGILDPHCAATLGAVVRRIFPLGRNVYEDKVASIWCAIEPIARVRAASAALIARLPDSAAASQLNIAVGAAALLTLLLTLPAVWAAFRHAPQRVGITHWACCLVVCALASFLAAWHVHEKTLLQAGAFGALALAAAELEQHSKSHNAAQPAGPASTLHAELLKTHPEVSGVSDTSSSAVAAQPALEVAAPASRIAATLWALQVLSVATMAPLLLKDGLALPGVAIGSLLCAQFVSVWRRAPSGWLTICLLPAVACVATLAIAVGVAPRPVRWPWLWEQGLASAGAGALLLVWADISRAAVTGLTLVSPQGAKAKQA